MYFVIFEYDEYLYKDRYLFVVDLLFIRKIKYIDWLNILYVLKCN